MQAKMANADKAIGKDMREKTADKLRGGEGHQLLFAIVAIIEILEGDCIFSNCNNAMIGDRNAEDVTPQILDQFLFVIEWGFDIDFPIFGQGLLQHALNIERTLMGIEFAIRPELGEGKAKTVAELVGKQFDGEEEVARSRLPAIASGGGYPLG